MQCKGIRDLLMMDYIDNELDEEARLAVERHLAGCDGCRTACASLRALVVQFRESTPAAAPAGLWTDIRRELARRREDRSFSFADVFHIFRGGWAYNAAMVFSLVACMSAAGIFFTGTILPARQTAVTNWETAAFSDLPGEQAASVYAHLAGGIIQ